MVNFDKVWNRSVPCVKGFGNQMVPFGERLKEERVRLGLNQSEFGAMAGVTKKTQVLYEQGERSPNADYMVATAQIGVDVLYVLTGQRTPETKEALSVREQTVLYNFRALSEADQAALQRLSNALAKSGGDDTESQQQQSG